MVTEKPAQEPDGCSVDGHRNQSSQTAQSKVPVTGRVGMRTELDTKWSLSHTPPTPTPPRPLLAPLPSFQPPDASPESALVSVETN